MASGGAQLKVWVLDGSPQALLHPKHAVRFDGIAEEDKVRFLALHLQKDAAYLSSAGRLMELDLATKEVAWEFGEGEKNRVVKA